MPERIDGLAGLFGFLFVAGGVVTLIVILGYFALKTMLRDEYIK